MFNVVVVILAVVSFIALVVASWMLWKHNPSNEESNPPAWIGELPTRTEPLPLEERILKSFETGSPLPYRYLRMRATESHSEWEEFWEILQDLEQRGEVIRATEATLDKESTWQSTSVDVPEPADWADELASGVDPPPRTDEDRILDTLESERILGNTPLEFKALRLHTIITRDEDFWEAMQNLLKEGKVVRVADATDTTDSLWDLPSDAEEEAE